MTAMLDLAPATEEMARLLHGISDEQLADPTPCTEYTLGDLVDHVADRDAGWHRPAGI